MIPLKLQIKNFLSYGPQVQTIDFEPHQLICLSGKNGHGKSALLDAITWAVWGSARKTSGTVKPDESLLRLGQTNMMVNFDFKTNGALYRIRREFTVQGSKATTSLDFGIINPQTQHMQPLTDKTIRATQEKINQTIGLTFEAFANSAFLRQGQSNEFSKKSPRERKEILASILGLDRFELLRKQVNERSKVFIHEKEMCDQNRQNITQELQQKEQITHQLAELENQIYAIDQNEKEITQKKATLHNQKKENEETLNSATQAQFVYDQLTSNLQKDIDSFISKVKLWRSVHRARVGQKTSSAIHDRKELEKHISALQKEIEAQGNVQATYEYAKQEVNLYKEQYIIKTSQKREQHAQKISSQQAELKHAVLDKEGAAKQLSNLEKEYTNQYKDKKQKEERLAQLHGLLQSYQQQEQQFERRKAFYQKWVAAGNSLKKEYADIQQKKELVGKSDAQCPLCEQALSVTTKNDVSTKLTQQEKRCLHQINRLTNTLKKVKELLLRQHEYINQLNKYRDEQEKIKHSLQEHAADKIKPQREEIVQTLENKEKEISRLTHQIKQTTVDNTTDVLENDPTYKKLRHELEQQETCLLYFKNKEQEYNFAVQQLHTLAIQTQDQQKQLTEQALQEQRKQDICALTCSIKKIKKELQLQETIIKNCTELQNQISLIVEQLHELEKQHTIVRASKDTYLQQKGALELHVNMIEKKEKEYKELEKRVTELNEVIDHYHIIGHALSKDGIQALLIEEAIPEIEQEANSILATLTDNQAQLFIESVKDLKSGATKETLDIKISDPLGIRPYEMFSGGEAFRIDFALRIAISKLLARRAGATLQFLIIDEGFGSQDDDGLAHIMDTLYKIQGEFAKIVIVSHLPSMKDLFPVHFHIQKTPQGSTIRVQEQG